MKPHEAVEKLRSVLRRKHLALATEETYVHWLTRFMRFVVERSPDGTPELKMGYLHAEAMSVRSPLEFA